MNRLTNDWRGMVLFSTLAAFRVLFIRNNLPELPGLAEARGQPRPSLLATLMANWQSLLYTIVLMKIFNRHGPQDLDLASRTMQHGFARIEVTPDRSYGYALALVVAVVAIVQTVLIRCSREPRGQTISVAV